DVAAAAGGRPPVAATAPGFPTDPGAPRRRAAQPARRTGRRCGWWTHSRADRRRARVRGGAGRAVAHRRVLRFGAVGGDVGGRAIRARNGGLLVVVAAAGLSRDPVGTGAAVSAGGCARLLRDREGSRAREPVRPPPLAHDRRRDRVLAAHARLQL